jgi:uncharacterized glyoxalase superfamily protein PhnB
MAGVIPYINVEGAGAASEFYQKAFGAIETARLAAEDGKRFMHIALEINGGTLMMADTFPEYGSTGPAPGAVTLQLVIDDIDAWWARAVAAGCTVVTPVQEMFWGDRFGALSDPFGVAWAMNAPVKKA